MRKLTTWIFAAALSCAPVAGAYGYKATVAFTGATGSTQTNITLAFSFSDVKMAYKTTTGGQIQNLCSRNGRTNNVPCDFVFTNDSTCATVTGSYTWGFDGDYNSTTGTGRGWVMIPSYTTSGVTPTVCVNNSGVSTYQGGAAGAEFDSSTKAVYHFPDGTTPSFVDYKGSANGTNHGTTASTNCRIDGCVAFNGSSQYVDNGGSTVGGQTALTVETWVRESSLTLGAAIFGDWGGGESRYILSTDDGVSGSLIVGVQNDAFQAQIDHTTSAVISANTLTHVVWTWAGSGTNIIYINGSPVPLTSNVGGLPSSIGTTAQHEYVGATTASGSWNGTLDELKISTVRRSANWVATEYANQNAPPAVGAFTAIGSTSTVVPAAIY